MTNAVHAVPAQRGRQRVRRNGNLTDREMTDMQSVPPSPEAVRLAMTRIRRAVDAHGGDREAPMDWGIVRRDGCRTIACHGGWYALGRLMDHAAVSWRRDADFPPDDAGETLMAARPDGTVSPLMYFEGGHALARDLGFMNAPALMGWAERHPEIWGCRGGERMFAGDGAMAFDRPPHTPVRVCEIVDWWLAVADRLDAAIPAHPDRADALAALGRHDAAARDAIAVEPCPDGWRLVRRPYPMNLPSLHG